MNNLKKFLHIAIAAETFIVAAAYAKPLPYTDTISNVPLRQALADAFALASTREDLSVIIVKGDGMKPYFIEGAILVIKHCKMETVGIGSIVVYKDRHLNVKVRRIGERNYTGDLVTSCDGAEVVTEDNYLGEVYVTFYTEAPSLSVLDLEFAKKNLKALVASSK
jgi:hypothetical protein